MQNIKKEELVNLILAKLLPLSDLLSDEFQASKEEVGVRYCVVDNFLPIDLAKQISGAFPDLGSMRLMDSFREKKLTSKNFNECDPLLAEVTFALQDRRVIALVERITNIKNQVPDPSLYAGGLSAMCKGHFLGPHIDNSHDGSRKYAKTPVAPDPTHGRILSLPGSDHGSKILRPGAAASGIEGSSYQVARQRG